MKQKKACGLHCIKMNNIGVKAGNTVILEDVNIHIHCGELTVIIGKNGAGKSTLLKAILGEIKHSGEIIFTDKNDGTARKMRVGYVPQSLNIDKSSPVSVYDLCASYCSDVPVFLYKSKKLYNKIKAQLAGFNAENLIDKTVSSLSGGELQRVLLSIATSDNPNLIILDEPVSGVDQIGLELFYENISRLKYELDAAIILVSHDLSFTKIYADKVVLLDKTVQISGSSAEVFGSDEFKRTFSQGV